MLPSDVFGSCETESRPSVVVLLEDEAVVGTFCSVQETKKRSSARERLLRASDWLLFIFIRGYDCVAFCA